MDSRGSSRSEGERSEASLVTKECEATTNPLLVHSCSRASFKMRFSLRSAQYKGRSKWWSGEIFDFNETNNTYEIRYIDGEHEKGVKNKMIRAAGSGVASAEIRLNLWEVWKVAGSGKTKTKTKTKTKIKMRNSNEMDQQSEADSTSYTLPQVGDSDSSGSGSSSYSVFEPQVAFSKKQVSERSERALMKASRDEWLQSAIHY